MESNPYEYKVECQHTNPEGVVTIFPSLDDAVQIQGVNDSVLTKADLLLDGVVTLANGSRLEAFVAGPDMRLPVTDFFLLQKQRLVSDQNRN
jgi:hypothetical protein